MRIGETAVQANVSIQTLRYYERLGLLPAPRRQPSGYRRYDDAQVRRIRFIRRAQDIGFTLAEIGDLLSLWPDSGKSCGKVQARAKLALDRIDDRIRDLRTMRKALAGYVTVCRTGPAVGECPLLTALGDGDADSPGNSPGD